LQNYEYDEDYDDEEYDDDDYGRGPRRVRKVVLSLLIILAVLVAVFLIFFVKAPAVAADGREDGVYTVLVVGRDKAGYNTDTMMVASLNTTEKTLDVVNIPRDTLVNVSWSVKKANSLLSGMGSIEGLMEGVGDMLGFVPDNYIVVNMEAFEEIVDTIGGVTFDVPVDMDYDDPAQDLAIHLSAGTQKLTGSEALGVFRWRQNNDGSGYAMGDIDRIDTQQALLKAIADQSLKITNVLKFKTFMDIFSEHVETDLETGNLAWYGLRFLSLDSDEDIAFHVLPGNYSAYLGGVSYVAIYPEEWLLLVNNYLNPYVRDRSQSDVSILTLDANGTAYVYG